MTNFPSGMNNSGSSGERMLPSVVRSNEQNLPVVQAGQERRQVARRKDDSPNYRSLTQPYLQDESGKKIGDINIFYESNEQLGEVLPDIVMAGAARSDSLFALDFNGGESTLRLAEAMSRAGIEVEYAPVSPSDYWSQVPLESMATVLSISVVNSIRTKDISEPLLGTEVFKRIIGAISSENSNLKPSLYEIYDSMAYVLRNFTSYNWQGLINDIQKTQLDENITHRLNNQLIHNWVWAAFAGTEQLLVYEQTYIKNQRTQAGDKSAAVINFVPEDASDTDFLKAFAIACNLQFTGKNRAYGIPSQFLLMDANDVDPGSLKMLSGFLERNGVGKIFAFDELNDRTRKFVHRSGSVSIALQITNEDFVKQLPAGQTEVWKETSKSSGKRTQDTVEEDQGRQTVREGEGWTGRFTSMIAPPKTRRTGGRIIKHVEIDDKSATQTLQNESLFTGGELRKPHYVHILKAGDTSPIHIYYPPGRKTYAPRRPEITGSDQGSKALPKFTESREFLFLKRAIPGLHRDQKQLPETTDKS